MVRGASLRLCRFDPFGDAPHSTFLKSRPRSRTSPCGAPVGAAMFLPGINGSSPRPRPAGQDFAREYEIATNCQERRFRFLKLREDGRSMQDIIDRAKAQPGILETYAPARLDRLPWGAFHTLVVIALGVTWVLDGLEVTLAGSVAGALKASPVLHSPTPRSGSRRASILPAPSVGRWFSGGLLTASAVASCSSSRCGFIFCPQPPPLFPGISQVSACFAS